MSERWVEGVGWVTEGLRDTGRSCPFWDYPIYVDERGREYRDTTDETPETFEAGAKRLRAALAKIRSSA